MSKWARDRENAALAERRAKDKARLDAMLEHAKSPQGQEETRQRLAKEAAESRQRQAEIARLRAEREAGKVAPRPSTPRSVGGGTRAAMDRLNNAKEEAARAAEKARRIADAAARSRAGKAVRSITRGAGKVMGVAEFVLPKESIDKGLKDARKVYETPAVRKSRVGSRKKRST